MCTLSSLIKERFDTGICWLFSVLSDYWGRYSYRSQPGAVCWGLARLADVLQIVVPEQLLTEQLDTFDEVYEQHYLCLMRKKVGTREVDLFTPSFFGIRKHILSDLRLKTLHNVLVPLRIQKERSIYPSLIYTCVELCNAI